MLTDRQFINVIRVLLGLEPIRSGYRHRPEPTNSREYTRLEALRKRADPDCSRCDGAGYTMGAAHDPEFQCQCVAT